MLPKACLPEERDDALEAASAMLADMEKEEEASNNNPDSCSSPQKVPMRNVKFSQLCFVCMSWECKLTYVLFSH